VAVIIDTSCCVKTQKEIDAILEEFKQTYIYYRRKELKELARKEKESQHTQEYAERHKCQYPLSMWMVDRIMCKQKLCYTLYYVLKRSNPS